MPYAQLALPVPNMKAFSCIQQERDCLSPPKRSVCYLNAECDTVAAESVQIRAQRS